MTSHVIAATILLDPIGAIGTLLRMRIEPLHRFNGRRTAVLSVIVVAALCTETFPTSVSRTFDAAVAHVFFGDYCYHPALAVKHGLGCQCDASVATVFSVLYVENVIFGKD